MCAPAAHQWFALLVLDANQPGLVQADPDCTEAAEAPQPAEATPAQPCVAVPAEVPVGRPGGSRAKGVLGNLFSPVFTLFNGSWDADGSAPPPDQVCCWSVGGAAREQCCACVLSNTSSLAEDVHRCAARASNKCLNLRK